MKRAIQKHIRDFVAILAIAVVALLVGAFILSNQRFYLPSWVPVAGSDFVNYNAEFRTAQAVTPGQGQTVLVAGVPVGEIGKVTLVDGRAVVQMKLRRKYTPIYKDATALLRPKTGLQDMVVELDPGHARAGEVPEDGTMPVAHTAPGVNADEFFAGFDADTRSYLQLLIGGAGQGLRGNAANLSATLKRFDPTARYLTRIGKELSKRDANIRRSIHNFRLLTEALGDKDTQLARFVDSSNRVFRSFANQEANLREALSLLPTALQKTNAGLAKSEVLSSELGPTLGELRPTARGLAPALKAFQSFAKETQAPIDDQLRPFIKTAAPTVAALEPAASDLASTVPDLDNTLSVINTLFNQLAYNPTSGPNKGKGYLYWLGWLNHTGASIFGSQDAHGPTRRGIIFGSCSSLQVFEVIGKANPVLGTLASLLNAPTAAQACPAAAAALRAQPSGLGETPPAADAATQAAAAPGTTSDATPAKAAGR